MFLVALDTIMTALRGGVSHALTISAQFQV